MKPIITPTLDQLIRQLFEAVGSQPDYLIEPWPDPDAERPVEVDGGCWSTTFADQVERALQTGPVVAVPNWSRFSGRRGPRHQSLSDPLRNPKPVREHALGLLLPASVMTSPAQTAFRTRVFEQWKPYLLLFARGGIEQAPAMLETVLVLLLPGRDQTPLKMFRVPDDQPIDVIADDLARLLKMQGGQTDLGFVLRTPPSPPERLSFELHDPRLAGDLAELAHLGSTIPLNELFDIRIGRLRPDEAHQDRGGREIRVIRGRDLLRDGTLAPIDDESHWVEPSHDRSILGDGDYLLRAIVDWSPTSRLVIGRVTAADLPAVAGSHVLVLREKAPLSHEQRVLFELFLRSRLAMRVVRAHASGVSFTPATLTQVQVPSPDTELAKAILDLQVAADTMTRWSREGLDLLVGIFEKAPDTSRHALLVRSRELRLRAEAAAAIDDFPATVRTRFPYPIAYRWRSLQALDSSDDTERAYVSALDCFEVLMAYAALVGLAAAKDQAIPVGALDTVRDRLRQGRGGVSLGDWIAILQEIRGRAFRATRQGGLLAELRDFLDLDDRSMEARRRLKQRRDDHAHLRRVSPQRLKDGYREAYADLSLLLNRALFLADMPLTHLVSTAWDTYERSSKIKYRSLMGDHPIVPVSHGESDRNDLEPDSLYVRERDGSLILLRPFLLGRQCPACHTWSTFHLDRLLDSGPEAKSLEHGHTLVEPPAALTAYVRVGLL